MSLQKTLWKRSLGKFSRDVLGFGKPPYNSTNLPTPEYIEDWYRVLENEHIRRLIRLAPRSHAKSQVHSINYALWEIYRNPEIRIVLASNTADMASAFGSEIRKQIETNPHLFHLKPSVREAKWTDGAFSVNRETQGRNVTLATTGVNSSVLSKRADIILCVPGDTKIDGYKKNLLIGEVNKGVLVKTHTGQYQKIKEVIKRPYEGDLIKIETAYDELLITEEHPIYIKGQWKPAKEVQVGDELFFPKNSKDTYLEFESLGYEPVKKFDTHGKVFERTLLEPELSYLLGFYVGKCKARAKRGVFFSTNNDQQFERIGKLINKYFSKRYKVDYRIPTRPMLVYSKSLSATFKKWFKYSYYGKKTKTRRLPDWIKNASDRNKASFLVGLFEAADVKEKRGLYTYVTRDEKKRDEIQSLLNTLSVYNINFYHQYAEMWRGEGGLAHYIQNRGKYFIEQIDLNRLRTIANDAYTVQKISRVKNSSGFVYNLEVEGDNSYIANGFAVHNCDDVIDEENSRTRGQREKVKTWFWKTLYPVLEPGGRIIVVGCLTADSKVLMADGTSKKIIDVEVGEKVWSVNDQTGEREVKEVEAMIPQGKDTVYEVRTRRHSLKATGNHPFLTFGDKNQKLIWKKAQDLKPDEFVITAKQFPTKYRKKIWNNKFATKDFYWFFGFLVGDGWVTKSGLRSALCACYGVDKDVNKKVKSLMEKYLGKTYKTEFGYYRADNVKARDLEDWGIKGGAEGKRIPKWVFKSRPGLKRAFLKGLVVADGTKRTKGNGFQIELANKKLIEDIYDLSLTCSVRPTTIYHRERNSQPPHSPKPVKSKTWSIGLTFKHWQEKENKTVCQTPFELLGLRMERITEVKKLDEREVFDLTVADTHNFIANGYVVHNTRWSYGDFYGDILGPKKDKYNEYYQNGIWTCIVQQAIIDEAKKEVLWEERWSYDQLDELRRNQSAVFACQYQNDPTSLLSKKFKWEWFKWYQREGDILHIRTDIDKEEVDISSLDVYIGVDPAISQSTKADYFALVIVGFDGNNRCFVLDYVYERLTFNAQITAIVQKIVECNPIRVGVETVAYQQALKQELDRVMGEKKLFTPIQEIKTRQNKATRSARLSGMFEGGRIFLEKENQKEMVETLLEFPEGDHDDLFDGLDFAVQVAAEARIAPKITWI